jgi:hypothetical protein
VRRFQSRQHARNLILQIKYQLSPAGIAQAPESMALRSFVSTLPLGVFPKHLGFKFQASQRPNSRLLVRAELTRDSSKLNNLPED